MKKQTEQAASQEQEQKSGQALAKVEQKQHPWSLSWSDATDLIAKHLPSTKIQREDEARVLLALREHPNLWRIAGDMARQAEGQLIEKITDQPIARLAMRHGVQTMREELGQKDGSLVERLLIDQIILCWLNVNWVQRLYSAHMADSVTLTVGMFWEKRLTMAQARYARAIETLAKVRRLSNATPLQVNIGGQQINVAGGGGASTTTG